MAPREIESWNQQGAEEMLRSKSPWASGMFQQGRCNKIMQTRDSPCMGSKCVSSFPDDIKQKVCVLMEAAFDEPHPGFSLPSVEIHFYVFQ